MRYVILILFTTYISYIAGLLLEKTDSQRRKKLIFTVTAILCLAVLFVFKYLNFTLETLSALADLIALPLHPFTLKLVLPIGISFYTFQTLSYVIDVYREKIPAEHNLRMYATFISFFPQLVAGPIERTENLLPQIKAEHQFNYDKAMDGTKLMLIGYFKKLIIADAVAGYVDLVYGNLTQYTGFDLVLAIFMFTIQIYCDFSGYSDIAIGTAKLLDFDLMTNFKSPYFSSSVKEFWSRWHISLSTWFRDYVYIPLGGNRCSALRHNLNLFITFLVSGLWHGASWTFVVWGGIHGLAQVIENTFNKVLKPFRENKTGHITSMIIVFFFCNVAWVFFRAESFFDAGYVLFHAFEGITDLSTYFRSQMISPRGLLPILIYIAILAAYDYLDYLGVAIAKIGETKKLFQWILYVSIGLIIVFCSQKGVAAEFVYFQF